MGSDRRRRLRRRRAPGIAGLVRERQPARQGDVRLRGHRPGRTDGDGERHARSSVTRAGRTRWVWRETDPMATYLATSTLGEFDLTVSSTAGVPVYVAVDPQLSHRHVLTKLPAIVAFYRSIYGSYPFDAVGAIVDVAPDVGYSLETQTKPVFRPDARRGDPGARALAPVVRRLGDADGLAGHLAARGLRHLVRVDLERARRRPVGAPLLPSSTTPRRRTTPSSGRRRLATRGHPSFSSTARTTCAGR